MVVCATCEKPYRNEAPLLVWSKVDGKGMVEPEPSEDWWLPDCGHKGNPKIVDQDAEAPNA